MIDLSGIVAQFEIDGQYLDAERIPSGHINDTYAVRVAQSGGPRRYLLQRINPHVFPSPEQVMHNIAGLTAHLRAKIAAEGGDPDRETVTLAPARQGGSLHCAPDGACWRAALFVEGARTYEIPTSLDQVYQAARAFGRFQRLAGDYPAGQLYKTIPDFHHTPKRFEAFCRAVAADAHNRARDAGPEIAFVQRRAGEMSTLVDLQAEGHLPLRVTHNDTKFNNVLIDDRTGEGLCVVDLDTVMPGLTAYDFGDAVRSAANPAAEDERDLGRVTVDLAVFEQLAAGYLDAAGDLLTPAEVDHLAFAARLMTLECGMRFLTDHLDGDVYFRIHRPGHNLDRCRTQFTMVAAMEERFDEMARIVERRSR